MKVEYSCEQYFYPRLGLLINKSQTINCTPFYKTASRQEYLRTFPVRKEIKGIQSFSQNKELSAI